MNHDYITCIKTVDKHTQYYVKFYIDGKFHITFVQIIDGKEVKISSNIYSDEGTYCVHIKTADDSAVLIRPTPGRENAWTTISVQEILRI